MNGLVGLGAALSRLGRTEEAIRNFQLALEIDPNDAAAHNDLGWTLASQGHVAEAVPHFKQALALDPNYANAKENLEQARRILSGGCAGNKRGTKECTMRSGSLRRESSAPRLVLAQLPAHARSGATEEGSAAGSSLEERTGTTRVTWRTRTLVGNDRLMQWKTGPGATAFPQLTFLEAVTATDGLGLDAIEGFNQQKVSPEIRKNLDDHLTPDEIAAVKNALKAANVQMRGYRVESLTADRNVFEFAKAVGAGLIIGSPSLASLAELDKLAGEFDIKVAIENRNAKNADDCAGRP